MKTREKRPEDKSLIYLSFTQFLPPGDSIALSTWSTPSGIIDSQHEYGSTYAQVFISGGTPGVTYHVENQIVTGQGRLKKTIVPVYVKDEAYNPPAL